MTLEACVVLVTCGSRSEAQNIAETVVLERLAACVNLLNPDAPVQSFYMWEGALQKDMEYLLVIKTETRHLEALQMRIRQMHSYTVPEFIALPVVAGAPAYLAWLSQSVQ